MLPYLHLLSQGIHQHHFKLQYVNMLLLLTLSPLQDSCSHLSKYIPLFVRYLLLLNPQICRFLFLILWHLLLLLKIRLVTTFRILLSFLPIQMPILLQLPHLSVQPQTQLFNFTTKWYIKCSFPTRCRLYLYCS